MSLTTKAINDPPSPAATKLAVIDGYDNFTYLFWIECGRRIAKIDWPKHWPDPVGVEVMRRDGFEVQYRN